MAAAAAAEHEFEFSSRDFERVRKLIYARAGISLGSGKQNMVYSRLSRRLRALGMSDFGQYLDFVDSGDAAEHTEFVNSLTTNLTAFWREAHHFPVLAAHIRKKRSARIWCCAASTGEEPYTIAITSLQAGVPAKLIATDIDTAVLDTARRAVYAEERVAEVAPDLLKKYFLKGSGENAAKVKVKKEVTSLVELRQLNLLAPQWQVKGPFDVIFCRNVMIYFDKPTQYAVLERLAALLEPGGLLFAGHSENFSQAKDRLRPVGRTVYERCY